MQPQGLHKRGYIKILWGLHKMGLHKHFEIFGGLHKKSGLGVTPKKNQGGSGARGWNLRDEPLSR